KRGLQTYQRAIEGHIGIESDGGDTAIPPGVEVLLEKDSVSDANHVLLVESVGEPEARTEALMESLLGMAIAIASVAPLRSRKGEPPRSAAGSRVRAIGIEE